MKSNNSQVNALMHRFHLRRGFAFGVIIIAALLAFEIFNYSTTEFALSDLLGDLEFMSIRWATILAIAFCGIDFAGIARLFTPESGAGRGSPGHNEAWYLFGAWLLAATMNAMLTWWGVSLAIISRESLGNAVVGRETLLRAVPIFVAILVWLIRVLIIGSFSVAGDQLFSQAERNEYSGATAYPKLAARPAPSHSLNGRTQTSYTTASSPSNSGRAAPKPSTQFESGNARPEPTYHPLSANSTGVSQGAPHSITDPGLARPATQVRR